MSYILFVIFGISIIIIVAIVGLMIFFEYQHSLKPPYSDYINNLHRQLRTIEKDHFDKFEISDIQLLKYKEVLNIAHNRKKLPEQYLSQIDKLLKTEYIPITNETSFAHKHGIAFWAGKKLTNVLLSIQILRYHKCNLPIEVWHTSQLSPPTYADVEFIKSDNHSFVSAILLSKFEHVLILGENVACLKDPTYLFLNSEATILWPNILQFDIESHVFNYIEPKQNTILYGQNSSIILINKTKCQHALQIMKQLYTVETSFDKILPLPIKIIHDNTWLTSVVVTKTSFLFINHHPFMVGSGTPFIVNTVGLKDVKGDAMCLLLSEHLDHDYIIESLQNSCIYIHPISMVMVGKYVTCNELTINTEYMKVLKKQLIDK